MTLAVTAREDASVEALYEQIPLLHNKPGFTLHFLRAGEWTLDPGLSDAFRVSTESGTGILVTVDQPLDMRAGELQTFRRQEILPLRMALPPTMLKGDTIVVRYAFAGVTSDHTLVAGGARTGPRRLDRPEAEHQE